MKGIYESGCTRTKGGLKRGYRLVALAMLFLIAGVSSAFTVNNTSIPSDAEGLPTRAVKAAAKDTEPIPVKLYFPKFDIESEIKPVGLTKGGAIDTLPSATQTAWYKPYGAPGGAGNSILNGHNRWKGKAGYFAKLLEMEVGDEVFIGFKDGTIKYFEITEINTVSKDDRTARYVEAGGEARMTLITCNNDYSKALGTARTRVIAICTEKDAPSKPFTPPSKKA